MADLFTLMDGATKCFITLLPRDKVPTTDDWPNNGRTFEEACYPNANVGIILGEVSGLLDVDLDCAEAVALADIVLPKPYVVFDRGTDNSRHYLYRSCTFGKRKAFNGDGPKTTIVELRGDGAQTMIPPSVHPEGQELSYTSINENAVSVEYDELLRSVALLAAAAEVMQNWKEGQRHDLALAFSGLCAKEGVEPNLTMHLVQRICDKTNDYEYEDRANSVRASFHKVDSRISGFGKLRDLLGNSTAKRISDRVRQYCGKREITELATIERHDGQIIDLGQFTDRDNVTEAKMGIELSNWLKGKALYAIELKKWMIWNDHYWELDQTNKIQNLAYEFVQDVKSTLVEHNRYSEARSLSTYESVNKLHNISSFASNRLAVSTTEFDIDPMILATGTNWVDLETGLSHPPNPDFLISKATAVTHNNDAECPRFLTFLDQVFDGDAGLIAFVQRAIGYSLTGSTDEQCMFIMIGDGANGKSTFIFVINALIGTYGTTAAAQTLIANGGNSVGDDLVDLVGARLISVSETEEGQSLAEAKIKQMTGGDTLKGRPLYGNFMEFSIIGKLWLATNSLPQINNSDHGIWRRIVAIPFNHTFKAEEQDKGLKGKLLAELPGILNWAIKGCLEWQKKGLNPPSIIEEQIADYKSSMDSVSQFVSEACELENDHSHPASHLYLAYKNWCHSFGMKPKSTSSFKRSMESLNGVYQKRTSSGQCWVGIQPCFISV